MLQWDTCKNDFAWDGSLRDIYVLGTAINDWRVAYRIIESEYTPVFRLDGKDRALPATADEAFNLCRKHSACLSFQVGSIIVASHFFTEGEIEFDLDPREVKSQSDLDVLLSFIQTIGNCTKKPVTLTPENARERPILTYDPETTEVEYHPAVK